MLTRGKRMALQQTLDRAMHRKDMERDWLSFVGCPFQDLEEVSEIVEEAGFHIVDCELFRNRRVGTDEFCRLIEWDAHPGFALLLPRSIPHTPAMFLYMAADHGIVSTASGYSSGEKYLTLAGKAWLVIMTPEDWEHAVLETGWDRSRLTRALGEYCWLHDSRYD
jgi:hypothetical protein